MASIARRVSDMRERLDRLAKMHLSGDRVLDWDRLTEDYTSEDLADDSSDSSDCEYHELYGADGFYMTKLLPALRLPRDEDDLPLAELRIKLLDEEPLADRLRRVKKKALKKTIKRKFEVIDLTD